MGGAGHDPAERGVEKPLPRFVNIWPKDARVSNITQKIDVEYPHKGHFLEASVYERAPDHASRRACFVLRV